MSSDIKNIHFFLIIIIITKSGFLDVRIMTVDFNLEGGRFPNECSFSTTDGESNESDGAFNLSNFWETLS